MKIANNRRWEGTNVDRCTKTRTELEEVGTRVSKVTFCDPGYNTGTKMVLKNTKKVSMSKKEETQATGNTIKNPDDWKTGEEPLTGAQKSYLHTLASEAGEGVDDDRTKAEASKKIDELQHKTGRGDNSGNK
jgi:hypothetical protein